MVRTTPARSAPDDLRRPAHRCARRLRPQVESLDDRVVLDVGLGDIAILSVTTADSRSLTFRYQVTPPDDGPAPTTALVGFYRSADPIFSPASDVPIGSVTITLPPSAGTFQETASLAAPLAIDPVHPYVLAVANPPSGVLAGSSQGDSTAAFRMFVIGAVAHGVELVPGNTAWVNVMAGSLKQHGYDVAIPFHWDALSYLPLPGMTQLAGAQLAGRVVTAVASLAPQMKPGDVIALHLIGHSRGAVVISQAALDLEALERSRLALAPLGAGPLKMTFLDPHPASNVTSAALYSAAPTLLGRIGAGVYHAAQDAMRDPNVIVPTSADWAEVFYQHTSYQKATNPIESNFLLWGQAPGDITVLSPATVVTSLDLTDVVPGHYLIHDWYQANVIPTLGPATGRGPGAARDVGTAAMLHPA